MKVFMFRVIAKGFKWEISKEGRSTTVFPFQYLWASAKRCLCVIKMNKVYVDVPTSQSQYLLSPFV
jgi:hypothetical protein